MCALTCWCVAHIYSKQNMHTIYSVCARTSRALTRALRYTSVFLNARVVRRGARQCLHDARAHVCARNARDARPFRNKRACAHRTVRVVRPEHVRLSRYVRNAVMLMVCLQTIPLASIVEQKMHALCICVCSPHGPKGTDFCTVLGVTIDTPDL